MKSIFSINQRVQHKVNERQGIVIGNIKLNDIDDMVGVSYCDYPNNSDTVWHSPSDLDALN